MMPRSIRISRVLVVPSSYCTRYGSQTPMTNYRGAKILQACEKQEKCRDAARHLVDEMDDFLRFGYEELEPELRSREKTRDIVAEIAKLIKDTCDYIIKNNKNMARTFLRTSINSISHKNVFINCRRFRLVKIWCRFTRVFGKVQRSERSAQRLH